MFDRHEPSNAFVDVLESRIGSEARNLSTRHPSHAGVSRTILAAGMMIVSMGVGAAAVSASYRSQDAFRRELLRSELELRLNQAEVRLMQNRAELERAQRLYDSGLILRSELDQAQIMLDRSETALQEVQLQLEEIALTAREPSDDVSSPLADDRDFVSERAQLRMPVLRQALDLETRLLVESERRAELGLTEPGEVAEARARVAEARAAVEAVERELAIRKQFLSEELDAVEAELRGFEAEAELRLRAVEPRVENARQELQRIEARQESTLADDVVIREARLRLLRLESEMASVELDLAIVRRRIEERRAGR